MSLQQDGSYRATVDSGHEGGSVNNISPILSTAIDHYLSIQPQTSLPDETASVLAHKHSTTKRIVQVVFTILACSLASGIVFGFAALKPILIEERVFHDLCGDEDSRENGHFCPEQDLKLNLFYTIGSTAANISSILAGAILDHRGSRFCNVLGCVNLAFGCGVMAISFHFAHYQWLFVGNFFLALGGTFVFVPSFQVANAFPQFSGRIVALVTGAFDVSAAIFLIYQIAYTTSGQYLTPYRFFLCFTAVPILLLVGFVVVMPRDEYGFCPPKNKQALVEDPPEDIHSAYSESTTPAGHRHLGSKRTFRLSGRFRKLRRILGKRQKRKQQVNHEPTQNQTRQGRGALQGLSARRQLATPWFILITLMTTLQMIRMNYFIATIRMQYDYLLSSPAQAKSINGFFDIALPLGGILSTPVIGYLLDNLRLKNILALIVLCTTTIGVLNCIPAVGAGYVTVILFVVLRPLYYSAMSDYATKVFGFGTFGRIYGTIICLSGLATFSQYGLDALTQGSFKGNPTPINAVLAVVGFFLGSVLVGFVSVAGRRLSSEGTGESSEEEEERPLLAADLDERWGYEAFTDPR